MEGEEKIGGFEEVCFFLGVGVDEEMVVVSECEVGEGDVVEMLKCDLMEVY